MSDWLDKLCDEIADKVLARQAGVMPGCSACTCTGCEKPGGCMPGHCVVNAPQAVRDIVAAGACRLSSAVGIGKVDDGVAGIIDHTQLKPETTKSQIELLCAEAAKYRFASVCVNPCWVPLCAKLLHGHSPAVCTVIGFPLGANASAIKAAEAELAVSQGAQEVDMVINVGALKSGEAGYVQDDIRTVAQAIPPDVILKVIIETCYLDDKEKVQACEAAVAAGAHFVKTSTGFGSGGATAADVALMRQVVGESLGVKASGGVRDCEGAQLMVRAGASRIGASAGVKIAQAACPMPVKRARSAY